MKWDRWYRYTSLFVSVGSGLDHLDQLGESRPVHPGTAYPKGPGDNY